MEIAKSKYLPLDLANGGAGKRTLKPLDFSRRPAFKLDPLQLGRHETPHLVGGSLERLQAVPAGHEDAQRQAQVFVSQAFFGTLLKQVRESPFKSELFSGGRGGQAFGSLYDQQLAERMAAGAGSKLVDSIVRRIEAAKAYARTSKAIERSAAGHAPTH